MSKKKPVRSPFPLAAPAPVGGFRMTIALKNPPYLNQTIPDFDGMEVYVHLDAPLTLLLTVENITEKPLRYTILKSRTGEAAYQVDVRGGPLRQWVGREEKVTPIKELLSTQAPFSLYGAQIYKERRGSILPLTPSPPYSGPPMMTVADSRWLYELLPGVPEVHTLNVDMLYDFTLGGLYRLSVRHLFPVHQPKDTDNTDNEEWHRYDSAIRHHVPAPGICEPAISNEIDVRIMRNAMESN